MVKLDKIYTRGGDGGETSLGDGTRVAKHSLRVHAQGDIDETNAAIGLARRFTETNDICDAVLARVQNDLFDLGADVTSPGNDHTDGNSIDNTNENNKNTKTTKNTNTTKATEISDTTKTSRTAKTTLGNRV